MKKAIVSALLPAAVLFACNKNNAGQDAITLTVSTTDAVVGQTVTVTATTAANTVSWSATPASSTDKAYSVSTEKTNYFTFSKPGEYVVGVRAGSLHLDSVHLCNHADSIGHHIPDSLWNHHIDSIWHAEGHHLRNCQKGQDSASVIIKVK